LYARQWYLNNTGSTGVADADIDAPGAWDVHKGLPSVIIAIIDEGVDINHNDLKDKIVTPYDAVDGDNDQQPNPWNGHGTSCAGIAAAVTNNSLGIAGIGWNVKIMPVRIAYSSGAREPWITTDAIIEDGIRTAVDRGAHVLSNSWGGGSDSEMIDSAIDYAIANNRVPVFAAGNESGAVCYPANLSKKKVIIAVSASNEWDQFKTKLSLDKEDWWGSNFGPEVTVSAPGVHICTTDISGGGGYGAGDYIENFNGTSSATPLVAGTAALVVSKNPGWTPDQVRNQLQNTADDKGTAGFDDRFGYGRVNACKALGGDCPPANNTDTCSTASSISLPGGQNTAQTLVNACLLFSTVFLLMFFIITRRDKRCTRFYLR
jgi:subtilisin family serine protease